MENIDFGMSMKNIPIPEKEEYIIGLTDSIEKVIKNMRWKLFWFKNKDKKA